MKKATKKKRGQYDKYSELRFPENHFWATWLYLDYFTTLFKLSHLNKSVKLQSSHIESYGIKRNKRKK